MPKTIPANESDRTPSPKPNPVSIANNIPNTTTNHPQKLLKKTIDAIKMCQAGIDPETALKATNLKETISPRAITNLKQKCLKYSLTGETTARLASHQIKRILKARAREEAHKKVTSTGEVIEYIDNIYPTDSNILAAASMVYDRYEPVKSQEQDKGSGNTYIDLTSYQVTYQQGCQQAEGSYQQIGDSPTTPEHTQVIDIVQNRS